jgi:microcystin-dependent protein
MARNGSGTYTKVNTFVAGNSIAATGHNQNWDDLATEITNSVAADGQTTMTGPLKAASGTVSAPGVTFASDTDCGLYRIGANNIGVAANGAKVLDVATTGLTVTGDINATTVKQAGVALLPLGMVLPYAGLTEPAGYLFCYGQAVSRTTYAALYAIVADTYGAGDASTTFNLPDLRGRVVAGQDDMGGSSANRITSALNGDTLGAAGGSETHALVTGELASHTHTGTTGSENATHTHNGSVTGGTIGGSSTFGNYGSGAGISGPLNASTITVTNSTQTANHQHTFTSDASGSGTAHNNTQPTFILNYIIFAGV